MKFLSSLTSKNRALLICAHPDDIEYYCGGTVCMLADQGVVITYVSMTAGDKGIAKILENYSIESTEDKNNLSKQIANDRINELNAACEVLGVTNVQVFDYPDGYLSTIPLSVIEEKIVQLIRDTNPDVILTFDPWKRYQLHPDHRLVGQVVLDATLKSQNILCYPEQQSSTAKPEFIYLFCTDQPNSCIDISNFLERKINALQKHESQFPNKKILREKVVFRAKEWGQPFNLQYGEAYHRLQPL